MDSQIILDSLHSMNNQYGFSKSIDLLINNCADRLFNNKKNTLMLFSGIDIYVISEDVAVPFLLAVPRDISGKQTLVLTTNNNESNDIKDCVAQAVGSLKSDYMIFNSRGNSQSPIMIPLLPHVHDGDPYYQQLSPDCLKKENYFSGYEYGEFDKVDSFNGSQKETGEVYKAKTGENGSRIDEAILKDVKLAKQIVESNYNGVQLDDKVFLSGYSSCGVFASRFALIHPDRVSGACIGGAYDSIPVPDDKLDYPLGIRNYKELFGREFDMDAYKQIAFTYYVGQQEYDTETNTPERVIEHYKLFHNRDLSDKDMKDILDNRGELPSMHGMDTFDRSCPSDIVSKERRIYSSKSYHDKDYYFDRTRKKLVRLNELGVMPDAIIVPNTVHAPYDLNQLKIRSDKTRTVNAGSDYDFEGRDLQPMFGGSEPMDDWPGCKIIRNAFDDFKKGNIQHKLQFDKLLPYEYESKHGVDVYGQARLNKYGDPSANVDYTSSMQVTKEL